MTENIVNGFRVCVILKTVGEKSKKRQFFVFVDLDKCSKIKHLEKHIKKLFNLDNIELIINGVCLPQEETIRIIQPDDTLTIIDVHQLEDENEEEINGAVEVKSTKKRKSKSKELTIDSKNTINSSDIELCINELKKKQKELLGIADHTDTNEEQKELLTQSKTSETTEVFEIPKVKRHRIRKRKRRASLNGQIKEPAVEDVKQTANCTYASTPMNSSGNHIRFFEDTNDRNSPSEGLKLKPGIENGIPNSTAVTKKDNMAVVDMEISDSPNEPSDTWKTSLLGLAKKGKKVFSRLDTEPASSKATAKVENENITTVKNDSINDSKSFDFDPLQYPIVKKVKNNDIIAFKKLKLDAQYCPVVSNYILAKIIEYSEETNRLKLKIIEGEQEFTQPDGKFNLSDPDVINIEEEDREILEFMWPEIIEPRLVFP